MNKKISEIIDYCKSKIPNCIFTEVKDDRASCHWEVIIQEGDKKLQRRVHLTLLDYDYKITYGIFGRDADINIICDTVSEYSTDEALSNQIAEYIEFVKNYKYKNKGNRYYARI